MHKLYYKLIVFLLILTSSAISFAQTVEYFKEYGYKDEIAINGARSEENIYIPVKENIDALNSYINLEFTCSNVLNFEVSIIAISVADIPVETRLLKRENQKITIKIPVKKKYIVSDFIKVTVKTSLRINNEICEIYSKGGFWVKITENSYFSYKLLELKESFVTKTISYIIPEIKNIVVSDNLNLKDIEYAAYIKFYLKRVYGIDLTIKTISEYENEVIKDAIILMPYEDLKAKIKNELPKGDFQNKGLVSVYNDYFVDSETEKTYLGSNIVVTGKTDLGYKKAAFYILQKHLLNSSYVDFVYINEEAKLSDIPKRKNYEPIYFNELGAANGILQGTGYLQSNITMPRSNFGSNVKNIEVNLTGRYRPLQKGEQGFFNLYFNDNFLTSYKLDNTGVLDINFNFDDIVMQQNNNFKYEFYFVPIGGLCEISNANFYGQIDIVNSNFKPIGYDVSSSLSFFRFPENFQSKPLVIYTDLEASTKMVTTLSELVDIINPGEIGLSGFIYPTLTAATLNNIEANKETSKIIISSNYDKYTKFFGKAAFLKFKNNAVTFEAEEISPFFNVEYQNKLGFNQLFYFEGSPIMLINVPKNYHENTLLSLVANIREQKISDTGNVIISNKNNAYFFDLRAVEINNDKSYISNLFNNFWDKYRIFIVSILLILVILLMIFIFQKSKESKEKIQNAK